MLRKWFAVVLVLMTSLFAAVPVFAQSSDSARSVGAVYVMTNATSGNQVLVYNRDGNGALSYVGAFATGGLGSGVGVTVPPDPLGSQNSLLLARGGRWLFAVNAGSNDISTFIVTSNGLKLVDRVASGGHYPVSLAAHGEVLYVLNAAGQGSISGFLMTPQGHLVALKGSTRSLKAATPADGSQPQILESPAQLGFSPNGQFLVVTDKGGVSGHGRILVFRMLGGTVPAIDPVITTTQSPVPFSFVFDRFGHLVVDDAAATTVTSYAISANGSLSTLSAVTTGQAATCWIAYNGQFIFTDNTGASTISAIQPAADGSLTLLNAVAANPGSGSLPLDMGITRDGRFLYSLETGAGAIGLFRINSDGSLTPLGSVNGLPHVGGLQGIAVR